MEASADRGRCSYACGIHLERCILGKYHAVDCICEAVAECTAGQALNALCRTITFQVQHPPLDARAAQIEEGYSDETNKQAS